MHLYDHVRTAMTSAWRGNTDVVFTMRAYLHSQTGASAAAAHSLTRIVTTFRRLRHADMAFVMRTYLRSQTNALANTAQSSARVVTTS